MDELLEFLMSNFRNKYVDIGPYKVYMRKGVHYCGDSVRQCLDIGNIYTAPSNRGKGGFRRMLENLEVLLVSEPTHRGSITHIYVESVLNEQLAGSLPSMGFTLQPNTVPPSFYRKVA